MASLARPAALAAALALAVAALLLTVPPQSVGGLPGIATLEEAVEEQAELQAPHDAMLARQLFGSDTLPSVGWSQAAKHTDEMSVTPARWELVGPTNIGGRLLDVVVDPASDTVYVAAASGGVWKSTDARSADPGTVTFEPAWPDNLTQAIGALAISSDGTLYAGTGETGPGGGSLTYGGTGVYRSDDEGRTWEHIGLENTSRIGRVAVDPTNPDRIFVAASGDLFQPSEDRGVYLSEDGGESWNKVLAGDNATTGAVDVAIDPVNPDKLFAALWDHQRTPDRRRYTGMGSGLYVSSDGGDTWTRTAVGLLGPRPDVGRIGVVIAPSDPDVIYATTSGESGAYAGVFKSSDGGTTWTPSADVELVTGNFVYGWWFGRMYVDPSDPNHVFHHGVNLSRSTNGGQSWSSVSGIHVDQHGMVWDPNGRVYLGNDGGFYISDTNGSSWSPVPYQPWAQLYTLDVGEQDPTRQVAGLQDNGVNRSYDSEGASPGDGSQWNTYGGGDGLRASINPVDQNIVYGCAQYGACRVSYDGGNRSSSFANEVVSSRKNWLTPIEFDPVDPSIVYTGGEFMSISTDDAATWSLISPQEFSNGPGRETNPLFVNYGTLTSIAPAARATGMIYAGTDDGNLWYSSDAGATWTKATDPDLPTAWITRVEVDQSNPLTAYVTYSGFRQGQDAPYVLRTTDGGRNWTTISANLPKAPVNDINVIGDALVVAGDLGVFISEDDGRSWQRLGELPRAPVHELRWHEPSKTLYVATFGRGMFSAHLPRLADEPVTTMLPPTRVPGVDLG